MKRSTLRGTVLLAVALGALAAAVLVNRRERKSEAPPRPRPNLLLVSIDTLRADRLGCYGYAAASTPRLDALAASGLRFASATTVAPLTLPAHASLLTGRFPGHHGVRVRPRARRAGAVSPKGSVSSGVTAEPSAP